MTSAACKLLLGAVTADNHKGGGERNIREAGIEAQTSTLSHKVLGEAHIANSQRTTWDTIVS